MRPRSTVLLLSALASCYHHDHHDWDDDHGGVPVFLEQEPNDSPATANHFGILRPGDHFFIDGSVHDDAFDRHDYLAFTAGEPLHVDFQLFIGNPAADLDVCLYDPLLDEFLACYATVEDPERGGVDVTDGGFDFHLEIESFVGDSSYSLEIVVQPLFAAATAVDAVPGRAVRATGVPAGRSREPAAERPVLELEQRLWIDERRGFALEIVRLRSD